MDTTDDAKAGKEFAPRFALVKDLRTQGQNTPEATFKRLGEFLGSSKIRGTLQLRIVDDLEPAKSSIFKITVGVTKARAKARRAANPRFELITTSKTWSEIAASRLAPLEAFLRGMIRVRGDAVLAQEVFREVAGSAGRTQLCKGEG